MKTSCAIAQNDMSTAIAMNFLNILTPFIDTFL